MKKGNRLLIVLGAAAITFATLQFTLGDTYRNHYQHGHKWNSHCYQNDQTDKPEKAIPQEK